MTDIEQKRAFVGEMRPSASWKKKVKHMSDAQVFAIYMRELHADHHKPPKEELEQESNDDDIPF